MTQAVTVDRSHIFISKDTTLSPRNIAGHEAFHLWKSGTGRDSYIEILEDNLLFSSEAFREYQTPIAEAYLGGEADLANDAQMDKMREEIFAYISGDIHEGTNEDALRPMFRDFDAVRAAWENLVEENQSTQARESRKGFSVDRELDREIRKIVKEAREGGRSEEAVQADIRALVQESYQRMAEQYGTIPAGERPAREARVPRRTAEDRVVSQTVRTVLEAGATPETAIPNIEELTARGVFSYTRYTDKQAMEDAEGVTRDIIGQTGINKLERETHIFQVEGGTVTLSTAQIMSLYELMKREQAQERIFIGGIRPETILGQRGIRESRKSAPVRVTAEDLSVYISDLKDRTTQSSLQKIFSVYCVSFSIQ